MTDFISSRAIGVVLTSLRDAAGISQTTLSRSLDRGQAYVSKVERGTVSLSIGEFVEYVTELNGDPLIEFRALLKAANKPGGIARVEASARPSRARFGREKLGHERPPDIPQPTPPAEPHTDPPRARRPYTKRSAYWQKPSPEQPPMPNLKPYDYGPLNTAINELIDPYETAPNPTVEPPPASTPRRAPPLSPVDPHPERSLNDLAFDVSRVAIERWAAKTRRPEETSPEETPKEAAPVLEEAVEPPPAPPPPPGDGYLIRMHNKARDEARARKAEIKAAKIAEREAEATRLAHRKNRAAAHKRKARKPRAWQKKSAGPPSRRGGAPAIA